MGNNKIKILNFILLLDFTIYIFSNLIIFKISPSLKYSIFMLCLRDVVMFLLSIFIYIYFFNHKVTSLILFPKINNKITKNSIIIGFGFYLIASGVNIIFTNIFKFTLKSSIYLNSVFDMFEVSLGFIIYIIVSTIFTELFFRVILNDAFKFLSYKVKVFLTSFIFATFFFGLSQFFYGLTLGMLLLSFLNHVNNVGAVIIASLVSNILNYLIMFIGKGVINEELSALIRYNAKNIFVDLIFPIIIALIGLLLYPAFMEKIKAKPKEIESSSKISNVTHVNFGSQITNAIDIYFLIFVVFASIITFISYVFFS